MQGQAAVWCQDEYEEGAANQPTEAHTSRPGGNVGQANAVPRALAPAPGRDACRPR
jgi:hypothetical protein